jgi:hypothetical protein
MILIPIEKYNQLKSSYDQLPKKDLHKRKKINIEIDDVTSKDKVQTIRKRYKKDKKIEPSKLKDISQHVLKEKWIKL